jgi:predicted transcriptional regulator
MSALLIRGLPSELHTRLKQLAQRNQRTLSAEAISLLEQAVAAQEQPLRTLPRPVVGNFPITDEWLNQAKNEGRA